MFGLFKKRTKAMTLSDTDIDMLFDDNKSAILMFGAGWCGACKMQKPLMHDLADHHKDSPVVVGLVDTDQEQKYSQQFGITALPTIIAMHHGEPVFKNKGLMSRRDLEDLHKNLR